MARLSYEVGELDFRVNNATSVEELNNQLTELVFQLQEEFIRLSAFVIMINSTGQVVPELNVEPERPRGGMLVIADGTNWNPGLGRGIYVYSNSAWQLIKGW